MSRIQLPHKYQDIISLRNLLAAWDEFSAGKNKRVDVQVFQYNLMDNLISLQCDLVSKIYRHQPYQSFNISDPKPRHIHKASVRDRVLHRAIYRQLYPFFDRTFIADSYSCRMDKGVHRALNRFRKFAGQVSYNHTRTCWVLKCDVRKFFASIDQGVLLYILSLYISDRNILVLLEKIINSFHSTSLGKGLPLGNLTSQLLVNIYMNEFDQYVKHKIKAKYYIRYADDFVILSDDREWLEKQIEVIQNFLAQVLLLSLHPDKTYIKSFAGGVDFLGWVHFVDHRVLRASTARRMFKRLIVAPALEASASSYMGLLGHGNARQIQAEIMRMVEDEEHKNV